MSKFIIISAISVWLVHANVQALTQQSFIERLRASHPFFNQQALLGQIKHIEKRATTANEDWKITMDASYQNQDVRHISSITNYKKLNTRSIDVFAVKRNTHTGGDIILKHTWKEKSNDLSSTKNQFSVDYNHPLLRNKDGINERLNTDVAQIAIDKNTLERLEAEEAFILEKLKRFIDLEYAQQQQLINERRLILAGKELTLVGKKYASSVVEKVDVLLQQDSYQRSNHKLLQAQQDLTLLRHEIAITLNLSFDQAVADIDLYKLYNPKVMALKEFLSTHSRVLKIKDLERKILKRQLHSLKNKSKAKLDLKLGFTSTGENNNYSNSLKEQSPSWKIGLNLSYPIGGIENHSNISKANAQLLNLKQYRQEKLLNIYVQTKTLKEKIRLLGKMLQSSQKQIRIAKYRTVEEKKRYGNGNGQASFVINAQNNEQNTQLSYAQIARDYQKTVLAFKAGIDKLVKRTF